jgi:hypothetical protein
VSKKNPFSDLEALRQEAAKPDDVATRLRGQPISQRRPVHKRARQTEWKRHFMQMPGFWMERLGGATRTSTFKLAGELLYQAWANGQPVVASNLLAKQAGVSPRSKSNALAELQKLDLIEVERCRRRSPRITLRHLNHGNDRAHD